MSSDELRAEQLLIEIRNRRSCDTPGTNTVSIGCALELAKAFAAEQVAQERERCAGIAEVDDAFGDIGESIRRTPKGEKL